MTTSENVKRATIHGAVGVSVRVDITTVNTEAATELRAALPKSLRLTGSGNWIGFYVGLYATGANDGKNETGIRRIRSLLKHLDKHGIALTFPEPRGNAITATELAEMIG